MYVTHRDAVICISNINLASNDLYEVLSVSKLF